MGFRFVPVFGDKLNYAIGSPFELIPLALLAVDFDIRRHFIHPGVLRHAGYFQAAFDFALFAPVIGAGLAGIVGLGLFYAFGRDARLLSVLSTGHGALQLAIERSTTLGVPLLLAIGFGKLVTTSLTIGSGGSGGVFGPSVLIGGCLGAAIGEMLHNIWPAMVPNAQVYGIVGMAGFFAAAAHAPISTIIMVSEMTGDYQLLLPTMWVATLCFLLCRRFKLYQMQVPTRLDSPAHRGDFLIDVLEGILVRDVPANNRPLVRVPEGTPFKRIMEMLTETRQHYFPVIDAEGRMLGIFSSDDVRAYLFNEAIWQLAVARDVMTSKLVTVTPEDDLNTALRRFTELNLDELPIVDAQDPSRLLGMLRRKDTIAIYNRQLAELKNASAEQLGWPLSWARTKHRLVLCRILALHQIVQCGEVHWFHQVCRATGFPRTCHVLRLAATGKCHDKNVAPFGRLTNLPRGIVAVEVWHAHIDQNHVGLKCGRHFNCVKSAANRSKLMLFYFQRFQFAAAVPIPQSRLQDSQFCGGFTNCLVFSKIRRSY